MHYPIERVSDFLTPKQVAEYLHVTPRTVRAWIAEGRLPALKTDTGRGGRLLVKWEDVRSVLTPMSPKIPAEQKG